MSNLIDKSALVAKIERRIERYSKLQGNGATEASRIFGILVEELTEFLSFINTIEVKEVDLEKETKKWWKEHLHLNPENELWMDAYQSVVFAKHFFELGMAVSNKAQKGEEV